MSACSALLYDPGGGVPIPRNWYPPPPVSFTIFILIRECLSNATVREGEISQNCKNDKYSFYLATEHRFAFLYFIEAEISQLCLARKRCFAFLVIYKNWNFTTLPCQEPWFSKRVKNGRDTPQIFLSICKKNRGRNWSIGENLPPPTGPPPQCSTENISWKKHASLVMYI